MEMVTDGSEVGRLGRMGGEWVCRCGLSRRNVDERQVAHDRKRRHQRSAFPCSRNWGRLKCQELYTTVEWKHAHETPMPATPARVSRAWGDGRRGKGPAVQPLCARSEYRSSADAGRAFAIAEHSGRSGHGEPADRARMGVLFRCWADSHGGSC